MFPSGWYLQDLTPTSKTIWKMGQINKLLLSTSVVNPLGIGLVLYVLNLEKKLWRLQLACGTWWHSVQTSQASEKFWTLLSHVFCAVASSKQHKQHSTTTSSICDCKDERSTPDPWNLFCFTASVFFKAGPSGKIWKNHIYTIVIPCYTHCFHPSPKNRIHHRSVWPPANLKVGRSAPEHQ